MNGQLWRQWRDDWDWIVELMKAKRYQAEPIEVLEPISDEELSEVVDRVGPLPQDFMAVVTERSAGVRFSWSTLGLMEKPPEAMRTIPDWGGHHRADDGWLFNVRKLPALASYYSDFHSELCSIFEDWPEAEEFADCVGFLEVGPRAVAVFKPDGKIAIVNNDDYPMPIVVADDFLSFMTMWSSTGCVGPDAYGIVRFAKGDVSIAEWRHWLESIPPRTHVDPDQHLDPCLCCGHVTVKRGPAWFQCRVCLWFRQDESSGARGLALAQARALFERTGVSDDCYEGLALTPDERAAFPRDRPSG